MDTKEKQKEIEELLEDEDCEYYILISADDGIARSNRSMSGEFDMLVSSFNGMFDSWKIFLSKVSAKIVQIKKGTNK